MMLNPDRSMHTEVPKVSVKHFLPDDLNILMSTNQWPRNAGKQITDLSLISYLSHFHQEVINEVPRIVHFQGFLVFFYFLQNVIIYKNRIFKYCVMTSWEMIKESREAIVDLRD